MRFPQLPPPVPPVPAAAGLPVPLRELLVEVARVLQRTEAELWAALAPGGGADRVAGRLGVPAPQLVAALRDAVARLAGSLGTTLTEAQLDQAVRRILSGTLPPRPPTAGPPPGTGAPPSPRPTPPGPGPVPAPAVPRDRAPEPAPAPPADAPASGPGAGTSPAPAPGTPARTLPGHQAPPAAGGGLPAAAPVLGLLARLVGTAPADVAAALQRGASPGELMETAGMAAEVLVEALTELLERSPETAAWTPGTARAVAASLVTARADQPVPLEGGSLVAAAEEVLRAQRRARAERDATVRRRVPVQDDRGGDRQHGDDGEDDGEPSDADDAGAGTPAGGLPDGLDGFLA